MEWDFDEEAVCTAVIQHNAKRVLLQFPDGLKPHAHAIRNRVQERTDADEVLIWAGSNFGACDIPVEARAAGIDLLIHFGHQPWDYTRPSPIIPGKREEPDARRS